MDIGVFFLTCDDFMHGVLSNTVLCQAKTSSVPFWARAPYV